MKGKITTFKQIKPGGIFHHSGWTFVKLNTKNGDYNSVNQIGGLTRMDNDTLVSYIVSLYNIKP